MIVTGTPSRRKKKACAPHPDPENNALRTLDPGLSSWCSHLGKKLIDALVVGGLVRPLVLTMHSELVGSNQELQDREELQEQVGQVGQVGHCEFELG